MFRPGASIFGESPDVARRLDEVRESLIKYFDPDKIILFGGYARNSYHKELTEMDLIIVANTDLRFIQRIKKAREICGEGEPHINPLVYKSEEFRQLIIEREGFIEDALEEGILIYEKDIENETKQT